MKEEYIKKINKFNIFNIIYSTIIIITLILITSFNNKKENIKNNKIASWYGKPFHGRVTATGDIYDMNLLTCATTWNAETRRLGYPFGTKLLVTNIKNNKSVIVIVNDTGSFGEKYNRELDLSKAAFAKIADLDTGIIKVNIKKLD